MKYKLALVIYVGLSFFLIQLTLTARIWRRARSDERLLTGWRRDFENGGSGWGNGDWPRRTLAWAARKAASAHQATPRRTNNPRIKSARSSVSPSARREPRSSHPATRASTASAGPPRARPFLAAGPKY